MTTHPLSPNTDSPTEGDLRVWWIPQVPGEMFYVDVPDLPSAARTMDTLAFYDLFQFDNNIKPDYANAGGVERYEDGEWEELDTDDYEIFALA